MLRAAPGKASLVDLPYFCEGTLIGDCLLRRRVPGAHVTAYVRGDRALMVVLNRGGSQAI